MPSPKDPEKRRIWLENLSKSHKGKNLGNTSGKGNKGKIYGPMSLEHKKNLSKSLTGIKPKKRSNAYRKSCSERVTGSKHPQWIGGTAHYWADKLKKIYKNCSLCKYDKNLIMHHKDHNRKYNKRINLIIICRMCHQFWHKN